MKIAYCCLLSLGLVLGTISCDSAPRAERIARAHTAPRITPQSNPINAYMGPNRLTALNQVLSGRSPRQAGTLIPVAQADEDLDFLFVKIEEVHPDPLGAFPNPETYVALKRWGHDALHSLSKSGAISA